MLLNMSIVIIILILISYSIIPTFIFKQKHKLNRKKFEDKVLYLTFDDGPSREYTSALLDLFEKYNIKGTFFIVANFAKENPHIINRMKKENHTIALHSLEHRNALFQSRNYTKYDFAQSIEIMNNLGVDVKFFRPPWGHFNIFTALEMKKYSLNLAMWDVMAQDWESDTTYEMIADKLLARSKSGDIICLHDGRGKDNAPQRTIKALARVIPIWQSQGYRFATMEEYYE